MQIASGPPLVGVGIEVKPTASNREVVKQYLLEHPDRVAEDTQEAIAQDLGVSEYLVSKAKSELEESGKQFGQKSLSTDEKRQQVREYVEDNPTASNREVVKQYLLEHPDRVAEDTQEAIAQDLGVARATVTRAVESLREDGKLVQVNELSTDEKRQQAREC